MDWFQENCGIRSLEISVEQQGAGSPTVHCFPGRTHLLIGRGKGNDLRLDDGSVSKRHLYLQAVAGRIFCIDLGSRTGVRWPCGPRLSGWLEWDEPLQVGQAVIRVARPPRTDAVGDFPSEGDLSVQRPAPKLVFDVIQGVDRTVRWQMNRLLALVGGAAAMQDPLTRRSRVALPLRPDARAARSRGGRSAEPGRRPG